MKFAFSSQSIDKISSDLAIVFSFSEKKDEKVQHIPSEGFIALDASLKGVLSKHAKIEEFTGKKGEMFSAILPEKSAVIKVLVVGLGEIKDVDATQLRETLGIIAKKYKTKINSLTMVLPSRSETALTINDLVHNTVEGLLLGTYEFLRYKKEEKHEKLLSSVIFANLEKTNDLMATVERAELFAQATNLARDLVNEQPTVATPTYLAKIAQDIAKSNPGITCKVYDKEQVEKMGMEAFLGIARASATPPKFIHLEYTPAQAIGKTKYAFVGKGITFDSGGINVKPGDFMQDMKMDMSGAAAVLGVFSVIAKLEPDVPVVGLIAATPNLISGTSIVPGDVVRAYNGKTIEVLNTDAEGRVTMADSLSYAVKQGATHIVDLATLTGACMVALGEEIAGLFSNDKTLGEQLKQAAKAEGEKVWELPLEKSYQKLNKSSVADIQNIGKTRYGGAITAALFLQEFVDGKPWVHLDIAGPAFSHKPTDLGPEGGTGFGVRTLLRLIETE